MCSPQLWFHPAPFVQDWTIGETHIDHYQHVNNVAYVSQVESLAWAHSKHLGLHFDHYVALDRGMVIRRHELDYLLPCHLGDSLRCATWIVKCDRAVSLTRQFQFICQRRNKTVFTARTQFICVSLASGKPKRMPAEFRSIYGKACVQENE
ncbi:acyl-CoA thioesterase [Alteromonas pelagimontana]|uniref:Acyl-CoA thioesterase n=1 Tax=Alteromonas pelagimontana TaxID=1858656 RepID=A0A6M4MH22_9ALTE|nr:thioesterase family protein [Alteromonas pelagimontana]QJR82218.1 acyl-CoA thioesterase [Alteromonas pelagimontana]